MADKILIGAFVVGGLVLVWRGLVLPLYRTVDWPGEGCPCDACRERRAREVPPRRCDIPRDV